MTTPTLTPPELLMEALAGCAEALDAAHAAGYAIPPVAAQGMASLGLVVTILRGQAAERTESPLTVAASMAEAERVRQALTRSAHHAPPIRKAHP